MKQTCLMSARNASHFDEPHKIRISWCGACYKKKLLFSSPEPKAHWWAYRIGRPPSSVCLSSTLFKHLLLRIHWADWSQISYGVSMGTKVCSNYPGHMTIFLKRATNEWSDKTFLLASKLCPLEAVSPCLGAIYMYKIMRNNCIKSRLQRDFF